MPEYKTEDYTVDQVLSYVGEDRELAAEALASEKSREGEARSTLVSALEKIHAAEDKEADTPLAPVPAEAPPVTVSLEPTPTAPGLLEQFEVTSERGHRRKV